MLGKQPTAIRIGDAKSRWGCCTAKDVLIFSWRLILAPPHVLDYLAAHEVAHLAEKNHGPGFWALVRRLDPDHKKSRAWLKEHGAGLHAVGRGGSTPELLAPEEPAEEAAALGRRGGRRLRRPARRRSGSSRASSLRSPPGRRSAPARRSSPAPRRRLREQERA